MNLNTAEKFLLIAQHPVKGRFTISDVQINYGIIGALLLEMSLENRIAIEENILILKNEKSSENTYYFRNCDDNQNLTKATKSKILDW